MKIFKGARGTGKTRELIEYAFENEYTIVCENPERMMERIYSMGYATIRVISYQDYLDLLMNIETPIPEGYVIDEIESFLRVIQIEGFTVVA